jgi:hypothetical protein
VSDDTTFELHVLQPTAAFHPSGVESAGTSRVAAVSAGGSMGDPPGPALGHVRVVGRADPTSGEGQPCLEGLSGVTEQPVIIWIE